MKQINDLNQGRYLDEDLQNTMATDFCIGVAGYPEKHFEAPSLNIDIEHLKAKVDAGADYIVTQLFFDNSKFFAFVDKCREAGITVPIVPGLKPLVTKRQLSILPQIFHVDIPDTLAIEVLKCKDNAEVRQVGIEWCIGQSKELKDAEYLCCITTAWVKARISTRSPARYFKSRGISQPSCPLGLMCPSRSLVK